MNAPYSRYLSPRFTPGHSPGAISFLHAGVLAALLLSSAGTAGAATASFTNNSPALGASDISQLAGAAAKPDNIGPDDNAVYIASNRPIPGQTFTTGGNANGYALTAVTLKQVA